MFLTVSFDRIIDQPKVIPFLVIALQPFASNSSRKQDCSTLKGLEPETDAHYWSVGSCSKAIHLAVVRIASRISGRASRRPAGHHWPGVQPSPISRPVQVTARPSPFCRASRCCSTVGATAGEKSVSNMHSVLHKISRETKSEHRPFIVAFPLSRWQFLPASFRQERKNQQAQKKQTAKPSNGPA